MKATYQNVFHEEIQRRFNLISECYHSIQNLLSPCLLPKNMKSRMFRSMILSVVLFGHKIWSLTLRENCGLRVFKNRGLKRDEVTGGT
jgi:hypothetical protein